MKPTMKKIICLVVVVAALCGCATGGEREMQSTDALDGVPRSQQLYDAQKIVNYFNKLNPQQSKAAPLIGSAPAKIAPVIEKITLEQAIAKHTPSDYLRYTDADVNVKTLVTYDGSRPWIEALGKALRDANIEMTVNLSKQIIHVKVLRTTLSEVLERYVPVEYRVYTDSNVVLDAYIKYDTARTWVEALGKPLAESGIELLGNLEKKIIFLRQIVLTEPNKANKNSNNPSLK
jgi:hypothetical protein